MQSTLDRAETPEAALEAKFVEEEIFYTRTVLPQLGPKGSTGRAQLGESNMAQVERLVERGYLVPGSKAGQFVLANPGALHFLFLIRRRLRGFSQRLS